MRKLRKGSQESELTKQERRVIPFPYYRLSALTIEGQQSDGAEIGWTIFFILKDIIFSKLQFYGRIHSNYGCVSVPITALENYSIMFAFFSDTALRRR